MKISELMIYLAIALQDHGDVPVLAIDNTLSTGYQEGYYEITSKEIDSTVSGKIPPNDKKITKALILF